ncbi:ClpXP protease specificity-enhancing factor [Dechloromonas denitrificans]|uniref:ClpXP protease specificity-enhancing factor n=1 Tax=Dechloromonas denitrificans TaxID=281362 RepID=UPI001CF906BD|nr:ClpXP protease specificity-enhancing factor [Dechloromonas denitrificans]UCV10880.1 ClpXP protease specificity-enhancing factor [Dechloromonas denitrificans]
MELPSTKPYLLRAIWEWCCDNGFTPYISVQVDGRTRVPREFVRDGQIVLNLGPDATNKLKIGNDFIDFQARFGGVSRELSVPVTQVTAIYSRENGAGMAFELEAGESQGEFGDAEDMAVDASPAEEPPEPPRPEGGRPKLQRIK